MIEEEVKGLRLGIPKKVDKKIYTIGVPNKVVFYFSICYISFEFN